MDDQLDLVRPITAWQRRALEAAEIPDAVHEAIARLRRGRRRQPVEIEMPPEAFSDEAEIELLDPAPDVREPADPESVAAAAAALAARRAPARCGPAAASCSATRPRQLTALAEFLQAPVVTTRQGKGAIDDRHPLSVGTAWVNKRVAPLLDDADVILAVGTHFGRQRARGRTRPSCTSTSTPTRSAATSRTRSRSSATPRRRSTRCSPRSRSSATRARAATKETTAIRAQVEEQLRAVGPQAAMVETLRAAVPDDGAARPVHHHHRVHVPHALPGLRAAHLPLDVVHGDPRLGASPSALGAKVGRPDRPVVCVTGDGGFLFAATELATAVQYGINTVTVVYNDNAYGNSNRDQRERFHGREIGTDAPQPRLREVRGVVRRRRGEALRRRPRRRGAAARRSRNNRPTVIEVPMDRLPSPF